jgi:YD repeat-containing protein
MGSVCVWWRRVMRCAVGVALLIPLLATAATYVYDANGRLRAVTSSSGASSEYIYDALGNIYAINAVPAGQLTIFAFTPNHGSVGTTVTIAGQGFSTTPASNIVKFNGVAATVSSPATATQLKVTVPTGATTGTISVQVGTSTTTSVDIFTVTSDAGVGPTISSFTPAVIAAGGTTTVNGNHFVNTVGATLGAIGEMNGTVSSLTNTSLSLTASSDAASGYITVTTPYGLAQSAQPLVVLPTGITPSQVTAVDYLAVNGTAQTLNVSASNSYGAYVFQGTAGQFLSLQFSTVTPPSGVSYTVYDPTQRVIASSSVASNAMSIHLPALTGTGTYLVLFASGSSSSVQLTATLQTDPVLVKDGSSIALTTTSPSQSVRIVFELTAGGNQSLGFSNTSSSPNGNDPLSVNVYLPESLLPGSPLNGIQWTGGGGTGYGGFGLWMYSAPTTGTYEALVTPSSSDTISFTATLSSPVTGTFTSGTAKAVNLTRPGQAGLLTFAGTAGDRWEGYLSITSTTPAGGNISVQILENGAVVPDPNNSIWTSTTGFANYSALPQTDTYQVLFQTPYAQTASTQFTIVKNPVQVITVDAAPQTITTTVPGENVYFSFGGTTSQSLSVATSQVTESPNNHALSLSINTPTGAAYTSKSMSVDGGGDHLDLLNLPQTGSYSAMLTPNGSSTMSFHLAVLNPLTYTLTPGTAQTVALTKPGQIALLSVNGTAGTYNGINLGSVSTTPSGLYIGTTVLDSNLNSIGGGSFYYATTTPGFNNYAALPYTGTYHILVEASYSATSSSAVTWASDPTLQATINGSAVNISTAYPGQNAYLVFSGTSGQNARLNIASLSTVPANAGVNFSLFTSAGSDLQNSGCSNPGCTAPLYTFPSNDTYTLLFNNGASSTFSFTGNLLSP